MKFKKTPSAEARLTLLPGEFPPQKCSDFFPVEILQTDHSRAKRKAREGKPLLMATFAFDSSKQESSSICQERWEGSSNCLEAATDAGLTPAAAASLRGNQIIFLSTHLSAF